MKRQTDIGKIPPQAIDFEEAILGAIMLESDSLSKISDLIKPESFYKPAHGLIFKELLKLSSTNKPIDLLSVTESLKKSGNLEAVGGAYAITMLTSRIASTSNIEYHAAIVQQKFIQREIIRISSEITKKAFEDTTDVFDLLGSIQEQFSALTGFERGSVRHISESLADLVKVIDRNQKNDGTLTGLPTGITAFDNFSNGLQNGDLIIISGETSNGKTSLALNIANHVAGVSKKVAIYSYEMADRQLAARLLSEKSGVNGKSIQYYKLSEPEMHAVHTGIGNLEKAPIYIDELSSSRFDYLERSIRSMVVREHIDLVVIDYLQLIKPTDSRKQKIDAIADIANDLKNLAKQLDIPIILISQLSRDKINPKPTLARLKGSGDIENAADIVWFVWQPQKYGYQDFECNFKTYESKGLAAHIIAKGRNIGTTEFVTRFAGPTTTFSNYFETTKEEIEYPY